MNLRLRMHLVLLLLVACAIPGLVDRARAQDRHDDAQSSMSATFQVTFGAKKPHWVGVKGTHVQEIRQGERPDYDMFKYKGRYYVHNGDAWYMSKRGQGRFDAVDEHSVPVELARVPSDHWHNYPPGWADKKDQWKEKDKGHGKHHDNSGYDHPNH